MSSKFAMFEKGGLSFLIAGGVISPFELLQNATFDNNNAKIDKVVVKVFIVLILIVKFVYLRFFLCE